MVSTWKSSLSCLSLGLVVGVIWLSITACRFKRTEEPGGNWEVISSRSWLPEAGAGESRLFRKTPSGRLQIARWVGAFAYLGDDCLLYDEHRKPTGRRYLAICGDRMPIVLRESDIDDWDISTSGLKAHPGGIVEGMPNRPPDLSAAEARAKAMLQPPRDQR